MKPIHPAAELFPLMDEEGLADLAADIKANGQREAIWLDKAGRILDGRNRAKACEIAGVFPSYQTWDGSGSPVTFVLSLNLHRRHLSQSQRAVVALHVEEQLAEEAEKRAQRARAKGTATTKAKAEGSMAIVPDSPSESQPPSRDQAGALLNVSGRYVGEAKALREEAPDLLPAVEAGTLTLPQARRVAAERSKPVAEPETIEQRNAREAEQRRLDRNANFGKHLIGLWALLGDGNKPIQMLLDGWVPDECPAWLVDAHKPVFTADGFRDVAGLLEKLATEWESRV